ncbi:MAG TPA: polyphosphate polymerase domain-containing protein [Aeromicrobium sp.]|nr:polyphosphate polymerase domain-containing protein [Aeromicrobium sp.]
MIVDAPGVTRLGLDRLASIDLATVLARAQLLQRVDRKYVVPLDVARDVIAALAESHQVLTVGGRDATSYRTTYYDTADLRCVRDHVKRRRRRFKARTRLYVEDDLCRLEVKTKDRRGETAKAQLQVPLHEYGRPTEQQHQFIEDTLRAAGLAMPGPLMPSVEVNCRRGTLVDVDAGVRVTFDSNLFVTHQLGSVGLDPGHVIVETKGSTRPGQADRLLQRAGHRPQPFSKYAAAGSLLHPEIPSNDVRHMVGRQLRLEAHIEGVAS